MPARLPVKRLIQSWSLTRVLHQCGMYELLADSSRTCWADRESTSLSDFRREAMIGSALGAL